MYATLRALALVTTVLLAACGGGGSGGGTATAPSGPQAAVITESNAKPVSANALQGVRNTSSTEGATGVPIGVQVASGSRSPATFAAIAAAARLAIDSAAGARLPTAVSVSETDACPLGGTLSISGNVANPTAGLGAGDTFGITLANCQTTENGVATVMNGQMSMTIVSGTIAGVPFHVVIAVTTTNLSVQAAGATIVSNGDVRLDWTASSATSETLVATGTSMTSRETVTGVTRTNTLRNYAQTLKTNGTTVSATLSANVETDNTRIAASGATYTVTTPTAVVWDTLTDVVSAGVIKVVGAGGSQLTLTFTGAGNATIQIDANGDGTFEKSISTTLTELKGLL
jgi:hypothetical protein